jgi:hypothetical protein
MRYLIAIIVTLAFCLPAQAEILAFKTATSGQQLDVATKAIEKKKEGGYLVINANLSNTASITVSEAQYLHYETKAGRKIQNTTIPSDMEIILVDNGKSKKMILRCFDATTGTYIVVNGTAVLKDIGGIQRYTAGSLNGSSVWQQVDFRTGSGTTKLAIDIKTTQLANTQNKTVSQVIQSYELTLEQTKGYTPE